MEQRRQKNIKNVLIEQRKKQQVEMEIIGGDPNSERINKTKGMIRHMKQKYEELTDQKWEIFYRIL